MAKIRVYELARDLNMTNKALLNKLKVLEIKVKSHMSSLEDNEIKKIKELVHGKKTDEAKDKRVQPSVIRRRRKAPVEETVSGETEVPSQETPAKTETVTSEPASKKETEPEMAPTAEEETKVTESPEKKEAEEDVSKDTPTPPKAVKPKQPPKKRGVAKIIRKPEPTPVELPKPQPAETPEPPTEAVAVKAPEPPVAPEPEAKVTPETKVAPETKVTPETGMSGSETKPESKTEETRTSTEAETRQSVSDKITEETVKTEEQDVTDPDKDLKKKKKKKPKKTVAAKIIKLSDVDSAAIAENLRQEKSEKTARKAHGHRPPRPARQEQPARETPAAPSAPANDKAADADQEQRGKKGKKKTAKFAPSPEKEKVFPKKKSGFKRKSIIEGRDLYETGGRGRKSKKGKQKPKPIQKTQITTPKAIKRRLRIEETIVLADLAKLMSIKANEMIAKLMRLGVMATVNQTIEFDTAELVASEFGYEVERAHSVEDIITELQTEAPDDNKTLRAPVVTIMGHVDHGKTSLLDVIRRTKVTDSEAGGITQHIGAYNVETENGQITFLDTPGHAAFSAMRARGAKVTDIVILVVAADDGVMPQTIEAINHSKAAEVPMIVAVNKMDKENADPDRIMRELSDHGVLSEEWGGDTMFVPVSAKAETGIDDLLDMVLLQAEVLELMANPDKLATGHVVEAKLDIGRGPVATVLVQNGTLKSGQSVVCGVNHGKIRMMMDDMGQPVKSAGPSIPVEIVGLSGVPEAGDELVALEDDKNAKQISNLRMQKQRSMELAKFNRVSLEGLFEKMQEGDVKELNVIIKGDVSGSIEALRESLVKLSTDEVKIKVAHAATGTVSESDISLAAMTNAIVLGFNVRPGAHIYEMAKEEHVDMRFYSIIYNAIQDIKDAMVGMMESTYVERVLGRAEVRETFVIPKKGTVAGSFVVDGTIERGQNVRLLREGVIVFDGKLASLRRFKDDMKEVKTGYECGIGIENYNDVKIGDIIECYCMDEVKPTME